MKKTLTDYFNELSEATVDRNPKLTQGLKDAHARKGNQIPPSGDNSFDSDLTDTPVASAHSSETDGLKSGDSAEVNTDSGSHDYQVTSVSDNMVRLKGPDGKEIEVDRSSLEQEPGIGNKFKYTGKGSAFSKASDIASAMVGSMKQGFRSGVQNVKEDPDLSRIIELSGIEIKEAAPKNEVTGPEMKSLVGNTSASHRPTVKLGKKLRLKRENEKAKRERKKNKTRKPE